MITSADILRDLEEFQEVVWNETPELRGDQAHADRSLRDGFQVYQAAGVVESFSLDWDDDGVVEIQFKTFDEDQEMELKLDFSFLANSSQDNDAYDAYDRAMRGI